MERRTVIDQIEIRRDGTVQVRLARQIVDGESVVESGYHRLEPFQPGADIEPVLETINAHLSAEGEVEVESAEWDRVRRVVAQEHTDEAVAAFSAKTGEAPKPKRVAKKAAKRKAARG